MWDTRVTMLWWNWKRGRRLMIPLPFLLPLVNVSFQLVNVLLECLDQLYHVIAGHT
jgi:hypothetical protein